MPDTAAPLIEAKDLVVGWNGRPVAGPLSFTLAPTDSLLVLGHNGAGKSTLLLTLFGLLPPISGEFTIGASSSGSPFDLLRRGFRYLGQGDRSFAELTVRRSRQLLNRLYGFGLRDPSDFDFAAENNHSRRVGDLSVGQRRIEALQLLSAGTPRLYFLDEPTAGIAPPAIPKILEWISTARRRGASFIIIEHNFRPLLSIVERALILHEGRVSYHGPASELDDELLAARYL